MAASDEAGTRPTGSGEAAGEAAAAPARIGPKERAALDKLFAFTFEREAARSESVRLWAVAASGLLAIGLGVAFGHWGEWGYLAGAGALGLLLGVLVFVYIAGRLERAQKPRLYKNIEAFEALAVTFRTVQRRDARALAARLAARARLDPAAFARLRSSPDVGSLADLLAEHPETAADGARDAARVTLLVARGDWRTPKLRRVIGEDGRHETFVDPLRLVAFAVVGDELVIGDGVVDSATGDRRETIERIALSAIASVSVRSERIRVDGADEAALAAAAARGVARALLASPDDLSARPGAPSKKPAAIEARIASVRLVRVDGGVIEVTPLEDLAPASAAEADPLAVGAVEEALDRLADQLRGSGAARG